MNKKYIAILIFSLISLITSVLQAQLIPCKVEIRAESEQDVRWAYSDYGKLTYSIYSGILRFEINTWLLSERLNNMPDLYRKEVLFPADSFMIRVWAIVSEDQIKPQGSMFDYVQRTIPGFIRWGAIEQSVMIEYALLFNQGIDLTLQFSQPSDERLPLFGLGNWFKPSTLNIYVKQAVINRTAD
ncbi:MAG: hypothetical protein N2167_06195 [Flavobacteriales bacterium]|nr:hypothetical protein [Flavobacteriales bacterium]